MQPRALVQQLSPAPFPKKILDRSLARSRALIRDEANKACNWRLTRDCRGDKCGGMAMANHQGSQESVFANVQLIDGCHIICVRNECIVRHAFLHDIAVQAGQCLTCIALLLIPWRL